MSSYTNDSVLAKVMATNVWWSTVYNPGDNVPVSGIYRCLGVQARDHVERWQPILAPEPVQLPPDDALSWLMLMVATHTHSFDS